nr:hypothetical protein [Tanacetum cinerariifolium]
NSRNIPAIGDKSLPEGTYTAAQALFDKDDPTKLLQRMDTYFMRPDKPYEKTGQVNQVVFLEGLARFKSKWFLYYGTADSKIAVATRPEPRAVCPRCLPVRARRQCQLVWLLPRRAVCAGLRAGHARSRGSPVHGRARRPTHQRPAPQLRTVVQWPWSGDRTVAG